MSLKIDVNTVARLLLKDGSWYEVLPGSLTMDAFEWTDSEGLVISSGDIAVLPAMGVRFKTRGITGWISCPSGWTTWYKLARSLVNRVLVKTHYLFCAAAYWA